MKFKEPRSLLEERKIFNAYIKFIKFLQAFIITVLKKKIIKLT